MDTKDGVQVSTDTPAVVSQAYSVESVSNDQHLHAVHANSFFGYPQRPAGS
jgi:hypothetical protein